jgi:hypothetical protein
MFDPKRSLQKLADFTDAARLRADFAVLVRRRLAGCFMDRLVLAVSGWFRVPYGRKVPV